MFKRDGRSLAIALRLSTSTGSYGFDSDQGGSQSLHGPLEFRLPPVRDPPPGKYSGIGTFAAYGIILAAHRTFQRVRR